jgi:hypothetical protein
LTNVGERIGDCLEKQRVVLLQKYFESKWQILPFIFLLCTQQESKNSIAIKLKIAALHSSFK